jgi:hypothetical protein
VTAQRFVLVLFYRGEVAVEVDEKAAQAHANLVSEQML